MVYSYTRYIETLHIFRTAERESDPNDEFSNIGQLFQKKRGLRAAPISPTGPRQYKLDSTYSNGEIGDDEEYDPSGENKSKRPGSATRHKKRKAAGDADNERPSKLRKNEPTAGLSKDERKFDKTSYVTLMLTGEKSKELQREIVQLANNDISNKDLRAYQHPDLTRDNRTYLEQLDEESGEIDNEGGRALRNRKVPAIQVRPNILDVETRCGKCKKLDEKCNCQMLPRADNDDIAPRRRAPSIAGPGPLTPPLREDSFESFQIPSAVKKGKQRALSPPTPTLPTPPPSTTSSTPPNTANRWRSSECSITDCSVRAECSQAEAARTPSYNPNYNGFFFDSSTASHRDQGQSSSQAISVDDSRSDDQPVSFTTQTKWSHPIDFRHIGIQAEPCKFCSDFRYGVWGETERTVRLRWEGHEYIELASSHEQPPKTKMCVVCALARLSIIKCSGHVLGKISRKLTDIDVYLDQVTNQKAPAAKLPIHPMCSLCPLPTELRCCTSQQTDAMCRPVATPNTRGCGLQLCQRCHKMFGDLRGKLRKRCIEKYMQEHFDVSKDKQQLRADFEFICENSPIKQVYTSKCAVLQCSINSY